MTTENNKLVDNFLKEIKKHLPEWLKNNKEKVKDILLEISSHIWDSAYEISGSDDPDNVSIQEAIARLGSPKEIAKDYKKRGTPKYFISEELWSTYSKVVSYFISIIFLVITVVQVVIFEPNNVSQALINGITLSYPTIITFIVIITAIFVGLSAEGYLPKDLSTQDTLTDESKDKKLDHYKPDEFLFNGLLGTLFGLLIIIIPVDMLNLFGIIINFILELFGQTTSPINAEQVISADLTFWLTLVGIVTVITGLTNLLKIKSEDLGFQLKTNNFLIFYGIADFSLGLYLLANMNLILDVLPIPETILFILCLLGIIGTIVEIFTKFSKNIEYYGIIEEEKSSSLS